MGGSINDDTEQKVNGDHSVRLESPGNSPTQRTIILSDFIEVKGLVRYNVSWYVKTFNAGVDFGGATADIHWYSERSEASWLGAQANTVNAAPTVGTTDSFVRKGTQVSSPSNAKYAKVALGVTGGPNNSAAKAWFENVQFEMGSVINQYNLIYNPDFELDMDANNFPDGWNGTNLTALDVLDTSGTRSGKGRCMKIVGSTTAAKSFSQEIRFIGTINTPIRMSGWSRAAGWAAGGTYRMKLEFYSNAVLLGYHTADFPKTDANWHMVDKIVYANGDFDMIKIYGMYENQSGTAWFDDFVVRLAEAPNAIMSAYNITQNGNFEVRDGQNNWPDEWVAFKGPTLGTYSMTWEKTNETVAAYSGDYMIKIANVPDWATVENKIREPLKSGITYTASAVIKTNNVSGNGAVLKFNILDAAGNYLAQKVSEVISGTRDWTRVVVTLSDTEAKMLHPNAARFRIAIGALGATVGEMYFDAVRVLEGNLITKSTYDSNGNYITSVQDQLGNTMNMVNDNRGNAVQVTDAKSNMMRYNYDKLDRMKQAENSRGLITAYFYDKEGNVTQIDNHQRTGPTTSAYLNTAIAIQYNEQLLPKKITDGNWRATNFEYNRKKLLKDIKQPNGKQIHYQYDASDRLQNRSYTGDTTQWSFAYDANSNLTSVINNINETTSFEYDNLNRATKVTFPAVFGVRDNIQYTYNPNNKVVSSQYSKLPAASQKMIYEFDQADSNMIITAPNNTSAEFMYDEESRLKKSDVRIRDAMKYNTYYDYDTAGRVVGVRTENITGAPVLNWSYNYDGNNNRIKDINNITKKRIEYSYDAINQLTEERYYDDLTTQTASKRITYQYDLLGNCTQKAVNAGTTTTTTYTYNSANEIVNVNGTPQYTHDYNGNMTSAYGYNFTYNAENQLIRIDLGGSEVARYEYDSNGLRTRKVTPARTERYYYDNGELTYVTEENAVASQNKLKYFFTRDTLGRLLHMIDYTAATPKTYAYILDIHGNVTALADENGNRVVNYEYDAWGNLTNTPEGVMTGNGEYLRNANPFRYSSYQFDTESGLYYLKARYYTATLGRFLTRDRVLNINLYFYCLNNPVNLIDNYGLDPNAAAATLGAFSGIYMIPGIGQVAILVTGVVIVAGVTIYTSSWLFRKVKDYIHSIRFDIPKKLFKNGNSNQIDLNKFKNDKLLKMDRRLMRIQQLVGKYSAMLVTTRMVEVFGSFLIGLEKELQHLVQTEKFYESRQTNGI